MASEKILNQKKEEVTKLANKIKDFLDLFLNIWN